MLSTKKLLYKITSALSAEPLTLTLQSGFSIPAWGNVLGFRIGNIGIVTLHGITSASNVSTDTAAVNMNVRGEATSTCLADPSANGVANLMIQGGNSILVNQMTANVRYYGTIVFVIKN